MKLKIVYSLLCIFVTQGNLKALGSTIIGGYFNKSKHSANDIILVNKNIGPKMCVRHCFLLNTCMAVNYIRNEFKCELLGTISSMTALQHRNGSDYTEVDRWHMSDGPCFPNPCKTLPRKTKCAVINLQEHMCINIDEGPYLCDFESNLPCFLVEDKTDDFDWTVRAGPTPSANTGPLAAYTGKRYKYIEDSSRNNQVARLVSSINFTFPYYCLTFAYHMHGNSIQSLEILTGNTSPQYSLFKKSRSQGKYWKSATVNISTTGVTKIFISATSSRSFTGDIAIDYVRLVDKPCI